MEFHFATLRTATSVGPGVALQTIGTAVLQSGCPAGDSGSPINDTCSMISEWLGGLSPTLTSV